MSIFNSDCDINKYKTFYAVAQCLSFSRATDLLHISQPAISHSIKELEEQLKTKLFFREGKKICLTEDGEKLYKYVEEAFNNIVFAERVIREKSNDLNRKIRIGIYSHLGTLIMPELMKEFSELYPHTRFVIFSSSDIEIKEKLKNKELDIAILHYPIFNDLNSYVEDKIFDLESCFIGNKYYFDLFSGNNAKVTEVPLILPMKGFIDTNYLELTLKKQNIKLKPSHRIYATELKKEMIKQNMGIVWGQKIFYEKEIKNKELFVIPIDIDTPSMQVSVAYDIRYLNKPAEEFLKFIKNKYNIEKK